MLVIKLGLNALEILLYLLASLLSSEHGNCLGGSGLDDVDQHCLDILVALNTCLVFFEEGGVDRFQSCRSRSSFVSFLIFESKSFVSFSLVGSLLTGLMTFLFSWSESSLAPSLGSLPATSSKDLYGM